MPTSAKPLALLALVTACYSPTPFRDCEVTCPTGSCPAGFTCEAGMCRVEGFTASCGTVMQDSSIDTSTGIDAMTDSELDATGDTACSFTCYARSTVASPVGSTPCQPMSNSCQANTAWLNAIDFCNCSVGEPALYIQHLATVANLALVAPLAPTGNSYSMTIDNGVCYGAGPVCPQAAVSTCAFDAEVDGWIQIPLAVGTHTFRFFYDDGTGCTGPVIHVFVVTS